MQTKRINTPACCGGKALVLKTNEPITSSLIDLLKSNGFDIAEHFRKAGMLYATNDCLIVSAPLGSNRLQLKTKKDDCSAAIDQLEQLISNFNSPKSENPDPQ